MVGKGSSHPLTFVGLDSPNVDVGFVSAVRTWLNFL